MKRLCFVLVLAGVMALSASAYDKARFRDGEELFKRCVPCHGQYVAKLPMGKDRDISHQSEAEIAVILRNYVAGKSEGAMTAQASLLDKEKIEALSVYIANMEAAYGEELFGLRCSGCHGKDANKSAFGKSGRVARLQEKELVQVVTNYQNGVYAHGSTANAMKGRAITLSDRDVRALARYIDSL